MDDDREVACATHLDWSALAERFRPELVAWAARKFRLRDEDARELTHQVIAEWLVRGKKFGGHMGCRSAEHFLAILCQNLNRRWIDHIRRTRRKEPLSEMMPMREPIEEVVVLLQRKDLIHKAFVRLPELQRRALYAVYIEGLTQDDAAERLRIDRRLVSDWKRRFEAALTKRAKEIGLDD